MAGGVRKLVQVLARVRRVELLEQHTLQWLSTSPLCAGLDAGEFARLSRGSRIIQVSAEDHVFRAGETARSVYLIGCGAIAPASTDATRMNGAAAPVWRSGDFIGQYALLETGRYDFDAQAVEASELLEIPSENFVELFETSPRFARNVVQALHARVRELHGWQHPEPVAHAVAVIVTGTRSRAVLDAVEAGLRQRGERVTRFRYSPSDAPLDQPGQLDHQHVTNPADARAAWANGMQRSDRLLMELDPALPVDELVDWLKHADQCVWIIEPAEQQRLLQVRERLQQAGPQLTDLMWAVWVLAPEVYAAPLCDPLWQFPQRHAVVEWPAEGQGPTRLTPQGIDRIVRRLRNIQLGLALGGGGARGLAHLGVFQAFEQAGIHFDCPSGASCGAMLGTLYAAGMDPDRTVHAFARDLQTPQGFRILPSSTNWYLLWQFRTGAWESMLRRYLNHWRLEQLAIPFSAVCVDLVSAREVVRESGDAVQAVLQSINLPGVSKPILCDGQALVDGSVLNTLPANALAAKNTDLSVGVSVGSRPRAEFGGNRPDTPTQQMRSVGLMETLLRVIETQGRTLDAIQSRAVDILIEPDTQSYSFSDFTRSNELAAVGRAAAEQQIAAIKWQIEALEQRATRELRRPRLDRA
jgi:predicted acylesterase/phospholipase RssA/CRP-like cAMP-binding protein